MFPANFRSWFAGALLLVTAPLAQAVTLPAFQGGGVESPDYPNVWTVNQYAQLTGTPARGYSLTINGSMAARPSRRTNDGVGALNLLPGLQSTAQADNFVTIGESAGGRFGYNNLKFVLNLNFDRRGVLRGTNKLQIFGTLPAGTWAGTSWDYQPYQLLFSANLSNPVVDLDKKAIGFDTTNFSGWLNQPLFTGGSGLESFWLYTTCSRNTADCGLASISSNNPDNWDYQTDNRDWNNFLSQFAQGRLTMSSSTFYGMGGLTTLPLPAGGVLLAAGLAALAGYARRRRPAA